MVTTSLSSSKARRLSSATTAFLPVLPLAALARLALVAASPALFTLAGCSSDGDASSSSGGAADAGIDGSSDGGGGGGGGTGGAPSLAFAPHKIPPKDTDPAIADWLSDHYAGVNEKVTPKGKLFVHLPGIDAAPGGSLLIINEAAQAGYHVIGLMYPNTWNIRALCEADPDLDCYENARLEIIDGADHSTKVAVPLASSILSRLTKLLVHLDAKYPAEGWSAYLEAGAPVLPMITFSGHSQGAGHAALIAKKYEIGRLVMFSGVTDILGGAPPKWVNANHITPNTRYYGLVHTKDDASSLITTAWTYLNMGAFGVPVDSDAIPPPYANSHQLTTSLPLDPDTPAAAHGSSVVDADTPLNEDGTPKLAVAWRYVIGP